MKKLGFNNRKEISTTLFFSCLTLFLSEFGEIETCMIPIFIDYLLYKLKFTTKLSIGHVTD